MKNQKGITLIALIITILVMLILAAVTISLVVSEDGVLSKAQTAENKMSLAEVEERAELVELGLKTDIKTKNFTGNVMEEYLNRLKEQFGEDCQIVGNTIIIENGKYKIIVKNDDLDREVIDTSDDIINNETNDTTDDTNDDEINDTADDTNNTIDYEEIGQLLIDMFLGTITEEGMQKLQEKNAVNLIMDGYYDEVTEEETTYVYLIDINILYQLNIDEGIELEYIPKENNPSKYEFLEDASVAKKELENVFLGRNFVTEFGNKTSKQIIEIILDNSEKIVNIDEIRLAYAGIVINNITVKNGENETTFGENTGYRILLKCEDNIVKEVSISYGT